MNNIVVSHHNELFGTLWIIGWLFTIGYLQLNFKKGFFALFVWPYYLGVKFRKYSDKI